MYIIYTNRIVFSDNGVALQLSQVWNLIKKQMGKHNFFSSKNKRRLLFFQVCDVMAGGACQGKVISSPHRPNMWRLRGSTDIDWNRTFSYNFILHKGADPRVGRWTNCDFTTTSQLVGERCWIQWTWGKRALTLFFAIQFPTSRCNYILHILGL